MNWNVVGNGFEKLGGKIAPYGDLYELCGLGNNLVKAVAVNSVAMNQLDKVATLFRSFKDATDIFSHSVYFIPRSANAEEKRKEGSEFWADCQKVGAGDFRVVPKILGYGVTVCVDLTCSVLFLHEFGLLKSVDFSTFAGVAKQIGNISILGKKPLEFVGRVTVRHSLALGFMFVLGCLIAGTYFKYHDKETYRELKPNKPSKLRGMVQQKQDKYRDMSQETKDKKQKELIWSAVSNSCELVFQMTMFSNLLPTRVVGGIGMAKNCVLLTNKWMY